MVKGAEQIGAVILAAGSSSRLGRPKQLVQYRDKTLLQHMVDMVGPFGFTPSLVLLGAHADRIQKATDFGMMTPVINEQWPEGIASGIRLGVAESVSLNPEVRGILFLLSDQPFVTAGLIGELMDTHRRGEHPVTACRYGEQIGVPAIFDRTVFPELRALSGDRGAKKIILEQGDNIGEVPFDKGVIDIDTPEDRRRLQQNETDNQI